MIMKNKAGLLLELQSLYAKMVATEAHKALVIKNMVPEHRKSAINLLDYLVFRSENIYKLQESLHAYGLSSLASSESHIKAQLCNVMKLLGNKQPIHNNINFYDGLNQLQQNTALLFGEQPANNIPFVMMTIDSEFGDDANYIASLLEHGMHIARINCAHDDAAVWSKMVKNIKKSSAKMGLPCKIYMDLAGPKIRTQIIGKGHKSGKLEVEIDEEILLLEPDNKPPKHTKAINCTLPNIVKHLQKGQRVLFDDGLFEAVVEAVAEGSSRLKITRISSKKPFIKSEKGINFPDTSFQVNPLTQYDLECLPFVLEHADMLGFSFVNKAADIIEMHAQLSLLDKPDFPIIAKIETNDAVNNLPSLLLEGMRKKSFGVMIARGDLAVEIGFERLSEIQDEILWICEAAHTPVIWATQVLESLNKQGLATRGEVTDAAHAALAECVMLNKGRHTIKALKSLLDILSRSRQHRYKQRHIFRELGIAKSFLENV
jgi:pyruvate kinase